MTFLFASILYLYNAVLFSYLIFKHFLSQKICKLLYSSHTLQTRLVNREDNFRFWPYIIIVLNDQRGLTLNIGVWRTFLLPNPINNSTKMFANLQ